MSVMRFINYPGKKNFKKIIIVLKGVFKENSPEPLNAVWTGLFIMVELNNSFG